MKTERKKKTLSIFKRPPHVFLILEDHDLVRVTCENDDQAVMYSTNTALVTTKTPWSHRQSSGYNHYQCYHGKKKKKSPKTKVAAASRTTVCNHTHLLLQLHCLYF